MRACIAVCALLVLPLVLAGHVFDAHRVSQFDRYVVRGPRPSLAAALDNSNTGATAQRLPDRVTAKLARCAVINNVWGSVSVWICAWL
jgi:hypothetical protein